MARAKKIIQTGITKEQMETAFSEYATADAQLAKISATIDVQITAIREEEHCDQADDPVMTFMEKGGKNIKFSTFDYSPETLKVLKGGTILDSKWHEPTATAEIYRAIELTTDTGLKFMFPKCRVFAKFNAKFVKNGMMLLEVTLKPVSPAPNKSAVIIG